MSTGRLSPSPSILCRRLGDEMVLLDLPSGRYFALNEVGAIVWSLLAEGRNVPWILDHLSEDYAVPRDRLGKDLEALLRDLENRGFVGPVEGTQAST